MNAPRTETIIRKRGEIRDHALYELARELEEENERMKTALAACVSEMKYSAQMGQPISEDRREFQMAAPFLANTWHEPRDCGEKLKP